MLNNLSRRLLVGSVWIAAVVAIVASSVAAGASLSTSALLLVVCMLPIGVALIMRFGAPPPIVAELLYAVNTEKEGR
jgi:hypothetical protein